jgi:tetratricopeptide (TPR) repeat protein
MAAPGIKDDQIRRQGGSAMQASTINMAQALLDRGRKLWEQDRYEEASKLLSRLLALRVLSPQVAERAQFYLGDIQLAQGHYSKARRHLAAAIGSGIGIGETHFLMACALEWDDESDVDAAYKHYRKAVELEPGQPLYSSAYALMRIRRRPDPRKYDRDALRRLRAAFSASPDDQDIVYNYALGLVEMGRRGEAQLILRRARKRWPDHPAFEGLWFDFMADEGLLPQPPQSPQTRSSSAVPAKLRVVSDDEPVLLKFPSAQSSKRATPLLQSNARLTTALRSLSASRVREISRNLAIDDLNDIAQMRNAISRSLRDTSRLQSVLNRLSVGSRHLIQVVCNAGGTIARKELRLRLDAPSKRQGPHWNRHRHSASPLDELRQHGLVYLTATSSDPDTPDTVMIPSDLRNAMRRALCL